MPYRVLFVCTGNICRSPTAEGAFRLAVHEAGLSAAIDIDSAGTQGYHIGDPPDVRSIQAAAQRGIAIDGLKARRVHEADFDAFDLILAMDHSHLNHLRALRREDHKAELRLFLDFHTDARHRDVPVRRWAADELTRVTGHREPFSAMGDKRTRDIAVEAWTEWWQQRGRAQLGGG